MTMDSCVFMLSRLEFLQLSKSVISSRRQGAGEDMFEGFLCFHAPWAQSTGFIVEIILSVCISWIQKMCADFQFHVMVSIGLLK